MADVIDKAALASYLRTDEADLGDVDILLRLTNGLIVDIVGERPVMDDYSAEIQAVAFEVAGRAYRNPDGYQTEQFDDYAYGRPKETRNAGVYLTDDERVRLGGRPQSRGIRMRNGWLA